MAAEPTRPVPVVELAAGERTLCTRDADGRVRCAGGLELPATSLVGSLVVTDLEVCARTSSPEGAGHVRCRATASDRDADTPFVELLRGPGFPCARDAAGGVWCFSSAAEDEATAAVIPVPLPAPARGLGGDGAVLYAWLDDGRLVRFPPPAHGGGAVEQVATGVTALASDGWTLACWVVDGALSCSTPSAAPMRVDRVAVGAGTACASGGGRLWCSGLGERPAPDVRALAAGTGFGCVLDGAGEVACLGAAPSVPR